MMEAWFKTDKEAGQPATAIKKSSQSSGRVSHLGKPKPLKATMIPVFDDSKYKLLVPGDLQSIRTHHARGSNCKG